MSFPRFPFLVNVHLVYYAMHRLAPEMNWEILILTIGLYDREPPRVSLEIRAIAESSYAREDLTG